MSRTTTHEDGGWSEDLSPASSRTRAVTLDGIKPGVNVDRVDVAAGIRELERCGGNADWETREVIAYALRRWARGEESAAERGAIDRTFHGVDLTTWRRVLAAAVASAEVQS